MRLALGSAQFGLEYGISNVRGQVTRSHAKSILKVAANNGLDLIDTAISYGESETCLGEIGVAGFKVITKLPAIPSDCNDVNEWVQKNVHASISRLRITNLYGLLFHCPEQLLSPVGRKLYQAVVDLRRVGLIQKIGISVYSPLELPALISRYQFDLVQAPFNLVDRRMFRSGWLRRLKSDGVEIHTRSTFLQGLLIMPMDELPLYFQQWNDLWLAWRQWLEINSDLSAIQACLAYPLSFMEIDRVIVGCETPEQLEQILLCCSQKYLANFPQIQSEDERLINPANWGHLQ